MTQWWDEWADAGGIDQLQLWLGDVDAPSRVRIRQRIAECGYESVLDCGAGLGIDGIGITSNLAHQVEYKGLEQSKKLMRAAEALARSFEREEPPEIVYGSINKIPFEDCSFDFVYARHIWEHLPRFDKALREMLRVAKLEFAVVFFMRPAIQTYLTRERDGLWQNVWSKNEIEAELLSQKRYGVHFWEHLGGEAILHVYTSDAIDLVDADRVRDRFE